MRVRLSLSILSCILVLVGLTAPLAHAAPAAQWPTAGSYDSPEATMLRTIREVVPPEVLQQTPLQLQQLDADTYLLNHPGLFWSVDQAPSAQAAALQLAGRIPNLHTTVLNGPQGFGIYLTYDTVVPNAVQPGLLSSVQ